MTLPGTAGRILRRHRRFTVFFGVLLAVSGCASSGPPPSDVKSGPTCEEGTAGCACASAQFCTPDDNPQPLVCRDNRCIRSKPVLGVPENPRCYTPCSDDLTDSYGTVRICEYDGLMEGCVGSTECVDGSCVLTQSASPWQDTQEDSSPYVPTARRCETDVDCPDYQGCREGTCFSDCVVDSDCPADFECRRRVCRVQCDTGENEACAQGFVCTSDDGVHGVCLPGAAPAPTSIPPQPTPLVAPDFALSVRDLEFSNRRTEDSFTITNTSLTFLELLVRRVDQTHDGESRTRNFAEEARLAKEDGKDHTPEPWEAPLFWLQIGPAGEESQNADVPISVPAGESVTVHLREAANDELEEWRGHIEVYHPSTGSKSISLSYSTSPEGIWAGSIYYMGDFPEGEVGALEAFIAHPEDASVAKRTHNALLHQWSRFISEPEYKLLQWKALVASTLQGSWNFPLVQKGCKEGLNPHEYKLCYPFFSDGDTSSGLRTYTDSEALKIPTGVVEMPFSIAIRRESGNTRTRFSGAVQSRVALQYPGNPPVSLEFDKDPKTCDGTGSDCLLKVKNFQITSLVGARSLDAGAGCAGQASFRMTSPWLLPMFRENTEGSDYQLKRAECRDEVGPANPGEANASFINASFAGANPVPDGQRRKRRIELIDGRLINQNNLFLLVREEFEARMQGAAASTFSSYAIVHLNRTPQSVDAEDYRPGAWAQAAAPKTAEPTAGDEVVCDVQLAEGVAEAFRVDATNKDDYIRWLIEGTPDEELTLVPVDPNNADAEWKPYYLCHDTGHLNGGHPDWVDDYQMYPEPCPNDSKVTYFLYRGGDDLTRDACNKRNPCSYGFCEEGCDENGENCAPLTGTCGDFVDYLVTNTHNVVLNPVSHCQSEEAPSQPDYERVSCEGDRQNLLAERILYEPIPEPDPLKPEPMSPLPVTLADAFQFRTRFVSNSGQQIGFVPTICNLSSELQPFCYDPGKIRLLRDRLDCLTDIYRTFHNPGQPSQDSERLQQAADVIAESFGKYSDYDNPGFERMYAELLIMLGDDAYTQALGSRFDVAQTATGSFEGNLFEPDGMAIPGGAGYEMTSLYRARQAYDVVLDRFYRHTGVLWQDFSQAHQYDREPEIVVPATVANFLNRVVLASTRKARASSQTAIRYQGFKRPDLARHVIERDFARGYLESVVLGEFLKSYISVSRREDLDYLRRETTDTQNLYHIALERMRETYNEVSDELTFLGDPVDFIPFPSRRRYDLTPAQIMIDRAEESLRISMVRDQAAIESRIQSGSTTADFQRELREVELRYENQLADLCGTFKTPDGVPKAAIPKFAKTHPFISAIPVNPCGLVGNGTIFDARQELQVAATDLRIAIQEIRDVLKRASIERKAVDAQCHINDFMANLRYQAGGKQITQQELQHQAEIEAGDAERELAMLERGIRIAGAVSNAFAQASNLALVCMPTNPFKLVSGCGAGVAAAAAATVTTGLEVGGAGKQAEVNRKAREAQVAAHEAAVAATDIQRTAEAQEALGRCNFCPLWLEDNTDIGSGEERFAQLQKCRDEDGNDVSQPGPIRIEANARIDSLMVDIARARLNALRAQLNVRLAQQRIQGHHHQALRLMAQQEEAEQLYINVVAAQNDPNIRLLRNAKVIDADRAFRDTLLDAYRATVVFEYYSAQSYGDKGQLYYARMAEHGDNNLQQYLRDLQRTLHDFDNVYGRPSKRVQIVSLRDDVLRIPRLDDTGLSYTETERINMFREALTDPARLNNRGYLSFNFAVTPSSLSPLTAIHKIEHVEAEIQGSSVGDRLGRVYLTQRGTSALRNLSDELQFMRLPRIRAVIDTFFNGVKPAFVDAEIYQDERLTQRPMLNSAWELGLNLRDEEVNKDIQVQELTDIRLYMYYEDFSKLD